MLLLWFCEAKLYLVCCYGLIVVQLSSTTQTVAHIYNTVLLLLLLFVWLFSIVSWFLAFPVWC